MHRKLAKDVLIKNMAMIKDSTDREMHTKHMYRKHCYNNNYRYNEILMKNPSRLLRKLAK